MVLFTNKLSVNNKILLLVLAGSILILSVIGFSIYQHQREATAEQLFKHMQTQLNDFQLSLQSTTNARESQLKTLTHYFLYEKQARVLVDSVFVPFNERAVMMDLSGSVRLNEREFIDAFLGYFNATTLDPAIYKPLLIFKSGKMVSQQTNEQVLITETRLFNRIRGITDVNVLRVRYSWPEDSEGAEERYMYMKFIPEFTAFVAISANEKKLFAPIYKTRNLLFALFVLVVLLLATITNRILQPLSAKLEEITAMVQSLAKGKAVSTLEHAEQNELGDIVNSLNSLVEGLKKTTQFSKELGSGNFDTEFIPLSEEDELGNSLIDMRTSLQDAEIERAKQKAIEEDRNWAAHGHAKFADILRKNNDNLNELAYLIISELVKYLDAVQGGLFILNKEDEQNPVLELTGCFAFDRRKYLRKTIVPGEGLVGACFLEKETVYMTDIPEGYMDIASGMGDTNPRSILIVPLNLNEETYGVIEVASLCPFEKHQIVFLEKIGEVIASTLSTVHNNMRTNTLLEQFQHQSEELREQEEELHQNMEELQATQEEAARREQEFLATLTAVNNTIGTIELDENGSITHANERYLSMAGVLLADIQYIKRSLFEKKKENESNISQQVLWEKLRKGESVTGTFSYLFNERDKTFYESYTPILDENKNLLKVIGLTLYEVKKGD